MTHTKPNSSLESLIYHLYPENNKLWIVNCLTSYVRIQNVYWEKKLNTSIISFGKPYKRFSHDTISRWMKNDFEDA